MHICVINSLYKPYIRGGAESIVAKQVRQLREQGHEVFVISTKVQESKKARKQESKFEVIDGVKVYRLDAYNLFTFYEYNQKPLVLRLIWLGIDLLNALVAYKAEKIIRQEKPDVVYTHNLRGLSYFILHILKVLKFKNIHTLHDIQYVYPSGLLIHGEEKKWVNTFFLRRWYEAWCCYWLGSPSRVIAPSQWLMDFYTSRGFFKDSEKIVKRPFSHPGASEESDRISDKRDSIVPITSGLQSDKGLLKLLYIGQIEKHKGILFLVEALKNSQFSISNFQLDIVGDGSKLTEIKRLVENDKRFVIYGQVAPDKVGEFYKQADITLVPSLTYENAPTVIYESLQAGTPVLASNIGGIPEIINKKNGWLFEPGNQKEFIKTFESLVN